jgi:hypothetical protein
VTGSMIFEAASLEDAVNVPRTSPTYEPPGLNHIRAQDSLDQPRPPAHRPSLMQAGSPARGGPTRRRAAGPLCCLLAFELDREAPWPDELC